MTRRRRTDEIDDADSLPEATAVAGFGVVLAVAALNLLNGLARLSGRYTVWLLGGERDDASDAAAA